MLFRQFKRRLNMVKKNALLLVKVDPPMEKESQWNNSYNDKHVAGRLTIPGFLSTCRYTKIEGIPKEYAISGEAKYLALYDLADAKVLKGNPYRRLVEEEAARPRDGFEGSISKLPKYARGLYEQIYPEEGEYTAPETKFVFVVGHEVPRNKQQEFNAWYNTEYLPALMSVPGFVSGRRFILSEPPVVERGGNLSRYLSIYDIENSGALESAAFKKAAVSPWSNWVRSWYTRKMCTLYRRIYPKVD
jgi:hypothetical protein